MLPNNREKWTIQLQGLTTMLKIKSCRAKGKPTETLFLRSTTHVWIRPKGRKSESHLGPCRWQKLQAKGGRDRATEVFFLPFLLFLISEMLTGYVFQLYLVLKQSRSACLCWIAGTKGCKMMPSFKTRILSFILNKPNLLLTIMLWGHQIRLVGFVYFGSCHTLTGKKIYYIKLIEYLWSYNFFRSFIYSWFVSKSQF